MRITILGCGCSGGVPLIGNNWGNCDPQNPCNRRTCSSILIQEDGDIREETGVGDGEGRGRLETILVDTSPDMRQQLLNCNLRDLTAVIYTHSHADHCHGIDQLRSVNWMTGRSIPIYADQMTMEELTRRFDYVFAHPVSDKIYKPSVEPHIIDGPFQLGSIRIQSFLQTHGNALSRGFRFNDCAYTPDVNILSDEAFQILRGTKVWILDCTREKPHPSHAHLERALDWITTVKPERAILTHMDHSMDYAKITAQLPRGVELAYDGMVLEV